MKAIILAAGFAQRLYPYIGNFPKPLLPIAGIPLLDVIIRKICEVDEVNEVIIVTNELYFDTFSKWLNSHSFCRDIQVISNGVKTSEKRCSW